MPGVPGSSHRRQSGWGVGGAYRNCKAAAPRKQPFPHPIPTPTLTASLCSHEGGSTPGDRTLPPPSTRLFKTPHSHSQAARGPRLTTIQCQLDPGLSQTWLWLLLRVAMPVPGWLPDPLHLDLGAGAVPALQTTVPSHANKLLHGKHLTHSHRHHTYTYI